MAGKCPTITKAGKACQGKVHPGSVYCMAHDPDRKQSLSEAGKKGGAAKSTARRQAKQWAALGAEIGDGDLAAILKSCMWAVKTKEMTPSEASAIATLARTAAAITSEHELLDRVEELERLLASTPQIRKVV